MFFKDNHFFYDLDLDLNKYNVKYGSINRPIDNFRKECINSAKIIGDFCLSKNLPISIAYSGGIDSEVICRCFKELDIDFTAYILRFENDLNKHDISYAYKFCKDYNIKFKFIDINICDFLKKDYLIYHNIYDANRLFIYVNLFLIDKMPGYVIFGGGDIKLKRIKNVEKINEQNKGLEIVESYDSIVPILHLKKYNRIGATRFYMFSPEQMLSWIQDPITTYFINNNRNMVKAYYQTYKTPVFFNLWPEMELREKYTGFEKLDFDRYQNLIFQKDREHHIHLDQLINMLK